MLNIYIGDYKADHVIEFAENYFPDIWIPEWFEDDFVKEMIKDVDQSEVISPYLIISPVLGPISNSELSGGVKALILMYKLDGLIFNATNCGNNCAKWIQRISELKGSLTIKLEYIMEFLDTEPFDIKIMQTGEIVHTFNDFVSAYIRGENAV